MFSGVHRGSLHALSWCLPPLFLDDELERLPRELRENLGRGRNTGYPVPPAQIPACGITAPGSCLRSDAEALLPPLVYCPVRSTLLPTSVCRSRPSAQNFPWPRAFSPRTPPVVGLLFRLSTFVRSLHRYYAPVRLPKSVHVGRTATAFSDRTDAIHERPLLGSPGFRAWSLHACHGSSTPRVRNATRDLRNVSCCLPHQATRSTTRAQ